MQERDVIVSAFATPPGKITIGSETFSKSAFAQPLEAFIEEPLVVGVDATVQGSEVFYDKAFSREATRYRDQEGSILRSFLASRVRGIRVRRICLVTFSAGTVFASKVLAGPDASYLDTVMVLDGLHLQKSWEGAAEFLSQSIGPWTAYGVRAAQAQDEGAGPMLINAHTHIARPAPTVGSTAESARALTAQVAANAPGAARTGYDPGVLSEGPPPPAVTLGPKNALPPPARTFESVEPLAGIGLGNYHSLDFGGTTGADHAFIAWFVQRGLWRALLAPRWNAGLDCGPPAVSGLGQTFCGPQGIVVPEGTYPVPEGAAWGWAAAGLAIGGAVGYAATRGL